MSRPESSWKERLGSTVKEWTQGLSFDAVVVILFATIMLILFHENGSSSDFRAIFMKHIPPSTYRPLFPAFYWYGCSLLMLGVIPFALARYVLGFKAVDLGVGLGDWRFGLKAAIGLYLAFLPILILVSYQHSFQIKYPLFVEATRSATHLLLYEGAYCVYFIGWEFMFRGFMLFGLKPTMGFHAVFIQTIPFAIMHFGKPQMETLAAVFAGVLLGYLALRTRSFWYGWLLHALVAVSNDILAILHKS